jgi:poly(3-hydroxybutyrate) depolymerase
MSPHDRCRTPAWIDRPDSTPPECGRVRRKVSAALAAWLLAAGAMAGETSGTEAGRHEETGGQTVATSGAEAGRYQDANEQVGETTAGAENGRHGEARHVVTEDELLVGFSPRAWLVIGSVGRYGRTNLHTDAIEAALVAGTWRAPRAGDTVTLPNGAVRTWEPAETGTDGKLAHEALGGGYAFTTVVLPETAGPTAMVLEARGHSVVYVNGVPRAGDPYANGAGRLPVLLQPGENELLLLCPRGTVDVTLRPATGPAALDVVDLTVPDLIIGEPTATWIGVPVLNMTTEWLIGLAIVAVAPDSTTTRTDIPPLPPLTRRKCAVELRGDAPATTGTEVVGLRLLHVEAAGTSQLHAAIATLQVRAATDKHKRTFISTIDGSVQYYAVTPMRPAADAAERPALVLTLHGASVEASGQANAYGHKDWAHIVAPTNRRPFGFDWEDWGRRDALEVLDLNVARLGTDPRRTYLTGHSMGGHGTWQIGAHYPDRFAAIAPSAGWISFTSYGGAPDAADDDAVAVLLRRAASPSDTLALARNYAQHGVYVLHGDADDNVPVREARAMRAVLGGFHTDFAYYERPGAGHWWGDACVDWPPLMAFLRERTRPAVRDVRRIAFATASPGVSARCDWLVIHNQRRPLMTSTVDAALDVAARRFTLTTENVARLMLDLAALRSAPGEDGAADDGGLPADGPLHVVVDGVTLENTAWPDDGRLWLVCGGDGWSVGAAPSPTDKSPQRCGPFRVVFDHRCVLVVGTGGTPEENAWALDRARYDAETFLYRGNGTLDILRDSDFDPTAEPDRSVVLYGHADMNRAWPALLGDSPVRVERGAVVVGTRRLIGDDLAVLLVRPRPGSAVALVGVIGGTGPAGLRLTERLPLFLSGVAWPDVTVLDATTLTAGPAGLRAAGFFGDDWRVETGEFAWRAADQGAVDSERTGYADAPPRSAARGGGH